MQAIDGIARAVVHRLENASLAVAHEGVLVGRREFGPTGAIKLWRQCLQGWLQGEADDAASRVIRRRRQIERGERLRHRFANGAAAIDESAIEIEHGQALQSGDPSFLV